MWPSRLAKEAESKSWEFKMINESRELGSQHAFDSMREGELIPGPKASA